MRLLIDVDREAVPITGWVEQPASARVAFTGLLELLAALELFLGDAAPDPPAQRG